MRLDFLYNFCLKHFSFYEEVGQILSKNLYWFSSKVPVMPLSDFN